ncbi:MAG TPA: DUF4268 domain-containing protein [Acidimicrobiales bacterium]|nr:DUF4268 domain-containing protein [Acidimicrobiales bacterium]
MTEPGSPADEDVVAGAVDDHRLGRLAPVDVRSVWSSESADFTPWLASNLQLLGDALGIDELELVQREVPVGPFFLDLLAKDAEGRTVAIENQLMPSEHGHLGQLLVYAAGRRADVVVWVATRFKEEYRAVLDWLNEHTDPELAFFGVEVRVVRIGSSAPAPIFDVVVQPNDWGKAQKAQRQGTQTVSTVALARQEFFRRVFDQVAERLPGFRVPKPSVQNWAPFKAGPFGTYSVVFAQSGLRVEVYLDSGNKELNKTLFDELEADRVEVERSFGGPLDWERLDDKRASRIAVHRQKPVRLDDETDVASAVAWAADQAIRFVSGLDQRLRSRANELRLNTPSGLDDDARTDEK